MIDNINKFVFLVEAVVYVANHANGAAIRSGNICKALGLPERYMENLIQSLVHANILKSVRGPKGGYTLAREKQQITLGSIMRALNEIEKKEREIGNLAIKSVLSDIDGLILDRLDKVTIEHISVNNP